jgi:hypothetical protein
MSDVGCCAIAIAIATCHLPPMPMSADIADVDYHTADVGYYRRCQLLSPMSRDVGCFRRCRLLSLSLLSLILLALT